MKVNGVGITNSINAYNANKKVTEKEEVKSLKDKIEISHLGKSLTTYSLDDKFLDEKERLDRINEIKDKIEKGTYKIDSKLVAKKLLNNIKENF
ncbi:flagellar biosynthesis anti-sigma factor FlgM [Clostridium botulinum]|uniref:flagellar biosynthesis anti-sigma factor FlgM n=1 Tax=Clostridium botulinum TaxID=1491 RepID=UPI0013F727FF|nr:flagellar biosynthesis anti-sigma factor FlgM [Clostridium botulinum]MBN3407819.1 flagellar biosynthesis anti-sigma factor FlgM [Clostridium botulinum]MBY6795025.1 flagellar biosynthesis anti-sigma factor FlgM [Clostridium botulinum]MBY6866040.1 flagellar biosynthesis anti-sigma factor FlgM [Clostridium botulinum]MBY6872639.1 flagellar biosynthesis anti-sigma factor FlgM [Clostridium botulinum]MBY6886619.1 flagellar biosynthesis anti-sigma factor FlgM [Clostridium botulinum]